MKKKINLPTIPKEHEIRFRNKFNRIQAYVIWQLELQEIANNPDDSLQNLAKKHLLSVDNKKFLLALYKILKHSMTFVQHFETQANYQVSLKTSLSKQVSR